MKKIVLVIAILSIVSYKSKSCQNDNNHRIKPESHGGVNHLIVVLHSEIWNQEIIGILMEILQKEVPGLPQSEPRIDISVIKSENFINLFKKNRNLLILQLDEKNEWSSIKDVHAQPQIIVKLKAKNQRDLMELLHQNEDRIVSIFKDVNIKSIQKRNEKNLYNGRLHTLEKLQITIDIPNKYRKVMDTLGSFLWMRSRISGGIAVGDQTNNILIYQMPMFKTASSILSQIIKYRDSIGKSFIRGQDEKKMYMITEKARTPVIKDVLIYQKKAFETRSTWEIFGAFNAGPFLNYAIVDERKNRIVIAEGFNYAPSVKKRDFMFELEAILKTIQIK